MDIQRIRLEVAQAARTFAYVEAHPTNDGGVFVKTVLQTPAGIQYVASIFFSNYPSQMPKVFITKPAIQAGTGHIYNDGHICYLHPNMWNPGRHNLEFVLGRTAKWLNKYEVWRVKRTWPGAEIKH
jgi:ubiquitin-protein ligase